jgi:hypothetical protein
MGNSYGLNGKGVDLSQGPPKRNRDVVLLLNLMMSSLCTVFSWAFPSYMLKLDFSLLFFHFFGVCVDNFP